MAKSSIMNRLLICLFFLKLIYPMTIDNGRHSLEATKNGEIIFQNGQTRFKLKFLYLAELTSDDVFINASKTMKKVDLAREVFSISNVSAADNPSYKTFTMSMSVHSGNIKADLTVYLNNFVQPGTVTNIPFGTTGTQIGTTEIKIDLGGWKFCRQEEKNCFVGKDIVDGAFLDLAIRLDEVQGKIVNNHDIFEFTNGKIGYSTYVNVNAQLKTMTAGYPKLTRSGKQNIITLRFPKPDGAVSYRYSHFLCDAYEVVGPSKSKTKLPSIIFSGMSDGHPKNMPTLISNPHLEIMPTISNSYSRVTQTSISNSHPVIAPTPNMKSRLEDGRLMTRYRTICFSARSVSGSVKISQTGQATPALNANTQPSNTDNNSKPTSSTQLFTTRPLQTLKDSKSIGALISITTIKESSILLEAEESSVFGGYEAFSYPYSVSTGDVSSSKGFEYSAPQTRIRETAKQASSLAVDLLETVEENHSSAILNSDEANFVGREGPISLISSTSYSVTASLKPTVSFVSEMLSAVMSESIEMTVSQDQEVATYAYTETANPVNTVDIDSSVSSSKTADDGESVNAGESVQTISLEADSSTLPINLMLHIESASLQSQQIMSYKGAASPTISAQLNLLNSVKLDGQQSILSLSTEVRQERLSRLDTSKTANQVSVIRMESSSIEITDEKTGLSTKAFEEKQRSTSQEPGINITPPPFPLPSFTTTKALGHSSVALLTCYVIAEPYTVSRELSSGLHSIGISFIKEYASLTNATTQLPHLNKINMTKKFNFTKQEVSTHVTAAAKTLNRTSKGVSLKRSHLAVASYSSRVSSVGLSNAKQKLAPFPRLRTCHGTNSAERLVYGAVLISACSVVVIISLSSFS